ncbi:MAG: hypothetical protein LUD03_02005 [Firmicutes bacterium]|nr:hypothetical protein [Bacillota bacterium]
MDIKIDFFTENFNEAIGAGIYQIDVCKGKDKHPKPLYIGESEKVLSRCADHLYELKKDPLYFGFDAETINDSGITLKFSLIETGTTARKRREKELIQKRKPLSQSLKSDWQKTQDEKVKALREFLYGCKEE